LPRKLRARAAMHGMQAQNLGTLASSRVPSSLPADLSCSRCSLLGGLVDEGPGCGELLDPEFRPPQSTDHQGQGMK
jgi:hypothetical protein